MDCGLCGNRCNRCEPPTYSGDTITTPDDSRGSIDWCRRVAVSPIRRVDAARHWTAGGSAEAAAESGVVVVLVLLFCLMLMLSWCCCCVGAAVVLVLLFCWCCC